MEILVRVRTVILILCAASLQAAPAPNEQKPFSGYRNGFHSSVLALQTLLDRAGFSCNRIDGFWGDRTEVALRTWRLAHGLEDSGIPDVATLDALGGLGAGVTWKREISSNDVARLVKIPSEPEDKAKLKRMDFESLLELLAEEGHSSEKLIKRLNPELSWPNPAVGSKVVIPDPLPRVSEKQYAASVRISLSRREVSVFDFNGKMIALFPCSIAREREKRPSGELSVVSVVKKPDYLYDPQLFIPGTKKTAKLVFPAGPNCPVGTTWIGLSLQGYGIHGTPMPERIGEAASHGCFRLANWNAERLAALVSVGTPVFVVE